MLQHFLKGGQIGVGFLGASYIGLRDDLNERDAAAVEVDERVVQNFGADLMQQLAGILLEVDAEDSDALGCALLQLDL